MSHLPIHRSASMHVRSLRTSASLIAVLLAIGGTTIGFAVPTVQLTTQTARTNEARIRADLEVIRYEIKKDDWRTMLDRLDLSEPQRGYADFIYPNYRDDVDDLRNKLLDELVPGLVMYRQAKHSDQPWTRAQIIEARRSRYRQIAGKTPKTVRLLDQLFDDLRTILAEPQLELLQQAMYAWHRDLFLNKDISGATHFDLVRQVDLVRNIDDLLETEPELAAFLNPDAVTPLDLEIRDLRERCLDLLNQYERELDRLLQNRHRNSYRLRRQKYNALVLNDIDTYARLSRKSTKPWLQIYRLTTSTADLIASLLEEANRPRLAKTLRYHFYHAYYPALYRPCSTDLIYEWILEQEGFSADQLIALEATHTEYELRLDAIRAMTKRHLIKQIEETGEHPGLIAIRSLSEGPFSRKYGQLFDQRRALSIEINNRFRVLVGEEQLNGFQHIHDVAVRSMVEGESVSY